MTNLRREFEKAVHLIPKMIHFATIFSIRYIYNILEFETRDIEDIEENVYFSAYSGSCYETKFIMPFCQTPTAEEIVKFAKNEHKNYYGGKYTGGLESLKNKGLNINFDNFDNLIYK